MIISFHCRYEILRGFDRPLNSSSAVSYLRPQQISLYHSQLKLLKAGVCAYIQTFNHNQRIRFMLTAFSILWTFIVSFWVYNYTRSFFF